MTFLDPEQITQLGRLTNDHHEFIINALQVHAGRMRDAADEARAAYEAGRTNPTVAAGQNASLITNDGYRQTVELLTEQADKARDLVDKIVKIIDDEVDGEDDEDPAR